MLPDTALQEIQDWTADYRRSARVDRFKRTRPKQRKTSLTAKQREAKRAADRRSYELHKHEIAERRKTARKRIAYYSRTIVRESIKRFADRREYIAPRIDKEFMAIWVLKQEGMSFSEAFQTVHRPTGIPWQTWNRVPWYTDRVKELPPVPAPALHAWITGGYVYLPRQSNSS